MDTIRVDICYRPLRIAFAIGEGDFEAFRTAVRLSYALWGGRFNPIVVAEREEDTKQLLETFCVDLIVPVGDSQAATDLSQKHPHLINPFIPNDLFIGSGEERRMSHALDIQNALAHWRNNPIEWDKIRSDKELRLYTWQDNDPLKDIFLIQLGAYPDPSSVGIDYLDMVTRETETKEHSIYTEDLLPADIFDNPSIAYLSRHNLKRHYRLQPGWDTSGFYVGDSTSLEDLMFFWNLRASDIPLLFVDSKYFDRYEKIIPEWGDRMRNFVSHNRHEFNRRIGLWAREENLQNAKELFGESQKVDVYCPTSITSWNGMNIKPPMMYFDEASTLGVMSQDGDKTKISFTLNEKPFCSDTWFHTQHLVASISFLGGLYGNDHQTLMPPYIREFNEFYARNMYFQYSKLRIEKERIGLIIDAADHDSFLYSLPIAKLFKKIFELIGVSSKPSKGGLITKQLISNLGGLQGGRSFKIPGVRRLLRTYGPNVPFTRNIALQLIGGKDPDNQSARFSDHENLFVGPRPHGEKLRPEHVLTLLVENGLFRIGSELTCPNCNMSSWFPLDKLEQNTSCDLCGSGFDATRQLVNMKDGWHYRRSGVLGSERHAMGAIPVVLTLQQLSANFHSMSDSDMYSVSLDLTPLEGIDIPPCEVDFVWMSQKSLNNKTQIIIAECKDQGPIDSKDIENLLSVAKAFPESHFNTYVLLAKLTPFTNEEIQLAKKLNEKYYQRAILLTSRELEPYHFFERTKFDHEINSYGSSPEDLAQVTNQIYFLSDSD